MTTKTMLQTVLDELQSRKGGWRQIAMRMEPEAHDAYYSWLTKLAQGVIKEPSVNRIQRLYDYFKKVGAGDTAPEPRQEAA